MSDASPTTANSNLEPAPARLKIGRNSYGLWYLSATPADPLWDRFDGPAYIRADLYEAKLDEAMKREMKLRRQLAKLEAPMSTSDPLSQSTSTCSWCEGKAGCSVCGSDLADSELPNEASRTVGRRWLERYGDHEDKAFVAAAVYRMMRLAMIDPHAPELEEFR